MIISRIGRHEVLLPVNHNITKIGEKKNIQAVNCDQFNFSSDVVQGMNVVYTLSTMNERT